MPEKKLLPQVIRIPERKAGTAGDTGVRDKAYAVISTGTPRNVSAAGDMDARDKVCAADVGVRQGMSVQPVPGAEAVLQIVWILEVKQILQIMRGITGCAGGGDYNAIQFIFFYIAVSTSSAAGLFLL